MHPQITPNRHKFWHFNRIIKQHIILVKTCCYKIEHKPVMEYYKFFNIFFMNDKLYVTDCNQAARIRVKVFLQWPLHTGSGTQLQYFLVKTSSFPEFQALWPLQYSSYELSQLQHSLCWHQRDDIIYLLVFSRQSQRDFHGVQRFCRD